MVEGKIVAYLYRYTDMDDNIIKYVGIVWSEKRYLDDRIKEHKKDDWCKYKKWKIEYLQETINTRTDIECLEAHYISLYHTDKYFNRSKSGWGLCSYLPKEEGVFVEYEEPLKSEKKIISTKRKYRTHNANKEKEKEIQLLVNKFMAYLLHNVPGNIEDDYQFYFSFVIADCIEYICGTSYDIEVNKEKIKSIILNIPKRIVIYYDLMVLEIHIATKAWIENDNKFGYIRITNPKYEEEFKDLELIRDKNMCVRIIDTGNYLKIFGIEIEKKGFKNIVYDGE